MSLDARFGIDLGGSTLRITLFDGAKSLLSSRIALATPTPAFVIDRIVDTCKEMRHQAGIAHTAIIPLGIGIAAMIDGNTGFILNAPNLQWRDVPFRNMLCTVIGTSYNVAIDNDVNAIAWGEFCHGAGIGARDTLTVYLGTGIGAGVISNGQLVQGAVCAGELGHCKIAWDVSALPCACGSRGCIEAYAGGAALQARIRRELALGASATATSIAGGVALATPAHVDAAAAAGDGWSQALWTEISTMLAIAVGNAVAVVGSEILIIGGGMMSRTPNLLRQTIAATKVAVPQVMLQRLQIVPAILGDEAGPLGAAELARRILS